jgi:hypothetical protein
MCRHIFSIYTYQQICIDTYKTTNITYFLDVIFYETEGISLVSVYTYYINIHIYVNVYINIQKDIYIYIYIYICMYIYSIYILYTHTYHINIHTYIHIFNKFVNM